MVYTTYLWWFGGWFIYYCFNHIKSDNRPTVFLTLLTCRNHQPKQTMPLGLRQFLWADRQSKTGRNVVRADELGFAHTPKLAMLFRNMVIVLWK